MGTNGVQFVNLLINKLESFEAPKDMSSFHQCVSLSNFSPNKQIVKPIDQLSLEEEEKKRSGREDGGKKKKKGTTESRRNPREEMSDSEELLFIPRRREVKGKGRNSLPHDKVGIEGKKKSIGETIDLVKLENHGY